MTANPAKAPTPRTDARLREDIFSRATDEPYLEKARASPVLKWAGGKRGIVPEIAARLPAKFSNYYEPFLGGGAVFFALEQKFQHAFLSDINAELMLTYKVIQDTPEPLIEALTHHKSRHSPEYYKTMRDQHANPDPVKVAARFIYLNKTCFNGLYRVNLAGRFNVPIGRYTNPTICDAVNIRAVHEVLKKASLGFHSFTKVDVTRGSLVYCDPPYDGTFAGYASGGFGDEEQKSLKKCADAWREGGAYVLLSNSDTPFIRKLYKGYTLHSISAPRNINCKGDERENADELLITSY